MHVQQMHSHNFWKQRMNNVLTKEWQYVSGGPQFFGVVVYRRHQAGEKYPRWRKRAAHIYMLFSTLQLVLSTMC